MFQKVTAGFVAALTLPFFVFIFLPGQSAQAQEGEFAVNFQLGLPQGPFQDQLDEIGFGIQGMAGYHIPFTPVMLGLDAGFLSFATDRRSEPLSPTIPDVRVNVENSYNMAHFHFVSRISGRNYYFRPYVEGLVGFNYLYTQSTVRSRGSQQEVFTDTNFDDFAFSYGIGAGMRFLVWDGSAVGQGRVYINTHVRYVIGGEAEYILPGSLTTSNGSVNFETSSSRTDLLSFGLGVSFVLGGR
jgi:hypothetical protein